MILVIYGDSISTAGYGDGGYASKLQEEMGLEKVYNYSIAATCLAATLPESGMEVIHKKENRHAEAEYVILWYGTNDWYFGNLPGDDNDKDEKTFCGALNKAIQILRETNPGVKIILPTPMLRHQAPDGGEVTGDALFVRNRAGMTQKAYTKAIKRIGAREGCTVIDMREATGFTLQDQEKYFPDGVHPSEAGCRVIAHIFADIIKGLE